MKEDLDAFLSVTKNIPEDDALGVLCDAILTPDDALAGLARYWLTHHDTRQRQQVVFALKGLLAEFGLDPITAQAYRRGYTAGLQVASDLFRGSRIQA